MLRGSVTLCVTNCTTGRACVLGQEQSVAVSSFHSPNSSYIHSWLHRAWRRPAIAHKALLFISVIGLYKDKEKQ